LADLKEGKLNYNQTTETKGKDNIFDKDEIWKLLEKNKK
jgi:hypothetical protein